MVTLEFEWRDENDVCKRMFATKFHPVDSWLVALKHCGWDNRTTLRTIDSRGNTVLNWWDVSSYLPILFVPANAESDLAFAKKNWPFSK